MEQNNLPSNPAQITKELVKASFNLDATRLNYLKTLQATESIKWTRENVNQDLLAPAKYVASKLTERKEIYKRPQIDANKAIQDAYNSVFNPLNDVISRKSEEKKNLALVIQKEQDAANAEIEKKNMVNNAIVDFIQSVTNDITTASTDRQIVLIEKRIGTEFSRKSFYGDFLDKLKSQCEALKPLIKDQKEYIKLSLSFEKSKLEAIAKGDESTAVDLRERTETLKDIIEENKIKIQEKAFEQVENSDSAIGVPEDFAPNASRTWWKWRVDDIQLLLKKNPELVDIIPNKEKIDAILKEKRESGQFKGKREDKLSGITFYQEKTYR